jgi:hypothetical protein
LPNCPVGFKDIVASPDPIEGLVTETVPSKFPLSTEWVHPRKAPLPEEANVILYEVVVWSITPTC